MTGYSREVDRGEEDDEREHEPALAAPADTQPRYPASPCHGRAGALSLDGPFPGPCLGSAPGAVGSDPSAAEPSAMAIHPIRFGVADSPLAVGTGE